MKFDIDTLLRVPGLANRLCINVSNRVSALADQPDDVKVVWSLFISILHQSEEQVNAYRHPARRPQLSKEAFQPIKLKATARQSGDKHTYN